MRHGFGLVAGVSRRSPAEAGGVKPGDLILSMGGHPLVDELDYRFMEGSETVDFIIRRDGVPDPISLSIAKGESEPLGIVFEGSGCDDIRQCTNKCIFCFVDQLPAGVRPSLRVKDDDYVHSFLNGNYITLTNVRDDEMDRILRLRFSPMYVSVHATEPGVRAGILGNPKSGDVMSRLRMLIDGGIEVHAQLVLVPDINDGPHLIRTLDDLYGLGPGLLSVAAVPVGLTGHRENLPNLRTYGAAEAGSVIGIVRDFQGVSRNDRGYGWAYASDEFFLKAGQAVPDGDYYDDYPQIDNGVGLVRQFLDDFDSELESHPQRYTAPGLPRIECTIATGESAAPIVQRALDSLPKDSYGIGVIPVENGFFGSSVTVAGLLTGSDFLRALKDHDPGDFLIIPDICLRQGDDVFLDGMTLTDLRTALGMPIIPCRTTGAGLLRAIRGGKPGSGRKYKAFYRR